MLFNVKINVVALQNVRKIYTLMCGQPSYSNRNLICYVTAPYSIPFRKWLLVTQWLRYRLDGTVEFELQYRPMYMYWFTYENP